MVTLFWTVFFCLGWRVVTDEGQILYFIRKPFEINAERYEALKSIYHRDKKVELIYFFSKPFILCITCFASIWGATVYFLIEQHPTFVGLVLNCFAAAFIQTFIYKKYVKLD